MPRKFKGIEKKQSYRGAMRWMSIGIEFAFICVIGAGIGYWLDTLEDSSPAWMVMCFFVSFGFMVYIMLKRAQRSNEEMEQDSDNQNQGK